jgi:APA family basic amino acid/polyamine antiporter
MIAMTTALVYAELSARMPFSGSSYAYIYATFGELPAWVIGWNMNLRYGATAGGLSRGWSSYFIGLMKLLGVAIPVVLYDMNIFGYVSIFKSPP